MTPTGAYINDYRPALVWDTTYLLPRRASWLFGDMIGASLTMTHDTAQNLAVLWTTAASTDGAEWTHSVWLADGSYTLSIMGQTHNGRGKLDGYLDGSLLSGQTQDWYSSAAVYNAVKTFTFTISDPGYRVIKLKVNGKNASSGGYNMSLTRMAIYPSSD